MENKQEVTEEAPVTYTKADLATLVYPTDRYPMLVVERTRKTLTLVRLDTANLPPESRNFPYEDWYFTVEEAVARKTDRVSIAHLLKDGSYQVNGCAPIHLGYARYYRNHMD